MLNKKRNKKARFFILLLVMHAYTHWCWAKTHRKNLFITFYLSTNSMRHRELVTCLQNNIRNSFITKIYVLAENGFNSPLLRNSKIVLIKLGRRPTYKDFFNAVNRYTRKSDISIIANNDIYFDHTLKLIDKIDMRNTCLALTRWNILPNGIAQLSPDSELKSSQDTWIFLGPVKPTVSNFLVGLPGCDNRIAYELEQAGYKLFNPCKSIKTYHLHTSNFHTYNFAHDKVPGNYKMVPGITLKELLTHPKS
jgi:hypothetical protein